MEQIPTEVMEKIENYINENIGIVFSDCDQDIKDANKIARSETKEAIEYGYRLLCEGKEKEIAELKDEVEWLTRKKQTIFELGMSWRKWAKEKLESQSQRISELERQNERLRELGMLLSNWPEYKTMHNL